MSLFIGITTQQIDIFPNGKTKWKTHQAEARKNLIETMQARWVDRELQRMQRAILANKGLHEEELERRREPMLKLKREARERAARRREIHERADELFADVVTASFPQEGRAFLAGTEPQVNRATIDVSASGRVLMLLLLLLFIVEYAKDSCGGVSKYEHQKSVDDV